MMGADARTLRVRVDGWSSARFARVEGNLVMFEVMSLGCACSTCFARLDTVGNRMQSAEVAWDIAVIAIPERGGEPSVVLVVEPTEMPEKVDAFLSDLLGLQISEVAAPAAMAQV